MELAKKETWEEKQARKANAAKALQMKHPYLIPDTGNSLTTAAKNIRIELKRAFPNCTFSVRTKRFSMGDSIDVDWTDGPTGKQVDEIIQKYRAGSFDGMTDSYNYSDDLWPEAFGDSKYIHGSRHYSDTLIGKAIASLVAKFGDHNTPTVEDYRSGNAWRTTPITNGENNQACAWSTLIMRECENLD